MRRLYCKKLLQGDLWRDNVVLSLTSDGMITGIEAGTAQAADECIYGIAVPGMPNVHSHAFQRVLAGRTGSQGGGRDSFWSWREAMYRCANQISPEQLARIAEWVFVKMLKAGFTSCAEFHYIHQQADGSPFANPAEMSEQLIAAAGAGGIAMTLLPVLYCTADFGKADIAVEQRRFANSPQQYLRLLDACQTIIAGLPLLRLGLAPHSLRAVPGQMLREVLQAWPDQHCPVHIHIAEQAAEVENCIACLGAPPVAWLLQQFPVNQRWCLVHATHMSPAELQSAATSRVIVGLCPTTEADLGDGVFATSSWLQAGGRFAVGSDSNVRLSVSEELRLLEYNARLGSGKRNVLQIAEQTCGRFLYQHAAAAGGIAIGQPVGRLEPGYRADLLELDTQHEMLAGCAPDVALDSWIFAADEAMLSSVWVAGRRVIEHGHHVHEEQFRAGFSKVMLQLHTT